MQSPAPKLVSFSGIDGAGKSTQIESLLRHFRQQGFRFTLLTFWDNVVAFRKLREFLSLRAFKGDKGVGSPEKPITRRDKNVTGWHTTAVRLFFYFLDALSLRRAVAQVRRSETDFIVFDRYIFDELANLPLSSPWIRPYVRLILKISPRPDVAFVIDADPEAAHRRKPEYPLEFVRENRNTYLRLREFVGGIDVVGPGSIDQMREQIIARIGQEFDRHPANIFQGPLAVRHPSA